MIEYKGTILERRIDHKRRFNLPKKWIDTTNEFCFLQTENELHLYPYTYWEKMLCSKKTDKGKIEFAKKTTHIEIKKGRLLLPKNCTWKKIDLIGMLDFIIIIESVI